MWILQNRLAAFPDQESRVKTKAVRHIRYEMEESQDKVRQVPVEVK